MLCGAIGIGGNGGIAGTVIAGMADRIWHVRVQDIKNLDLLNSTPLNGLSSLSPLGLLFQSSMGSLTP